jgi:hypothetical protein
VVLVSGSMLVQLLGLGVVMLSLFWALVLVLSSWLLVVLSVLVLSFLVLLCVLV